MSLTLAWESQCIFTLKKSNKSVNISTEHAVVKMGKYDFRTWGNTNENTFTAEATANRYSILIEAYSMWWNINSSPEIDLDIALRLTSKEAECDRGLSHTITYRYRGPISTDIHIQLPLSEAIFVVVFIKTNTLNFLCINPSRSTVCL